MFEVLDMPRPESRPSLMERMVFRGLVFNMSWEDPEMDRRAFRLTPDDTVLSITSAGCNPLNFLSQNPKRLICVDGNPAQNAMMELKLAAISKLDYPAFSDIFAARYPGRLREVYGRLRPMLTPPSAAFWDKSLKKACRGIYRMGRMAVFCRIVRTYLRVVLGIRGRHLEALVESRTLDEQRKVYEQHIAPKLWRKTSRLFVAIRPIIYLAGVHPEQFRLVNGRHDMYAYVRERIEYVLTQVPIYDNYFMSLAATGKFRGNRVPPYLLEENFEALKNNVDRVLIVNGWLGPFLDTVEAGSIDKFNLLDIFDWMSEDLFRSTLESVLRAASPGATVIYRSGSYKLDPPEPTRRRFHHDAELSKELLAIDRSGVYGSFYVLTTNGAQLTRTPEVQIPKTSPV